MNDEARLKLKNMVNEYKPEETTDKIRKLKHSRKIKSDVMQMLKIKKNNSRLKMETVKKMCEKQCSFLRENYTNIFNKLFKGDLDLMLLDRFISILKDIEDGKLDQHEASAKVGAILKEIYIDSALREDKKIMYLAGIFENNEFCLITEQAKDNVNKIHHRQPVILNELDVNRYLNLELSGSDFLKESKKTKLLFHEVSKEVNKPTNNIISLIQPTKN